MTKFVKTFLASFFLLLFISGKSFGFHILLHDHDAEITECESCEKILIDQFSPLELTHDLNGDIDENLKKFKDITISKYGVEFFTTEKLSVLFGRPPPFY